MKVASALEGLSNKATKEKNPFLLQMNCSLQAIFKVVFDIGNFFIMIGLVIAEKVQPKLHTASL